MGQRALVLIRPPGHMNEETYNLGLAAKAWPTICLEEADHGQHAKRKSPPLARFILALSLSGSDQLLTW